MTDKQKLKELTSIIESMMKAVTYGFRDDLEEFVEDAAMVLEFDVIFTFDEMKYLKKLKFKISDDKKLATKTYRGTPVYVKKEDFNDYTLGFGEDSKEYNGQLEDFVYDIDELKSTSEFFKKLLKEYKKGLEEL